MKPEKRFPDSLTEAFKPAFHAPQEEVAAACDRVLHRLQNAQVAAVPDTGSAVERVSASARWFRPVLALSGVAAMILVVFLTSVDSRAVVESADGGELREGDRISAGEVVRANGGAGITLKLPDGSRVEMRSKSELFWERANDGLRIQLKQGSVIVNAAKQRAGHLYVQTKDVTVSVIGTVFLVNAQEEGSRVSVIEGEVRVQQGNLETKLRPGEHVSTALKPESRAVSEEIVWSPKAEEHLALLQQSRPSTLSETPRQRFEEAAIRLCPPPPPPPPGARGGGGGGGGRIEATPGRFYAPCKTVAELIEASHPVVDPIAGFTGLSAGLGFAQHVRGGPEWIYTDRYTIEAITAGSTDTSTMMKVMLAELLERRLQIKVHIETEQVSALALEIAPGGLKIKPLQEGDCEREKKTKFPNPKPRCGMSTGDFNGANWRWEQGSAPLGVLAALGLSAALRMPVIDRTGTTDKFALILEYGPDESTPRLLDWCRQLIERNPDQLQACSGRPTAPSVHTVLSQIGLKVDPIKAPREFVVVDRAERPSEN